MSLTVLSKGAILIMSHRTRPERNHSIALSGKIHKNIKTQQLQWKVYNILWPPDYNSTGTPFAWCIKNQLPYWLFKALSIPIRMKSPSGQHNLTVPHISSFLIPPCAWSQTASSPLSQVSLFVGFRSNLTLFIAFSALCTFYWSLVLVHLLLSPVVKYIVSPPSCQAFCSALKVWKWNTLFPPASQVAHSLSVRVGK